MQKLAVLLFLTFGILSCSDKTGKPIDNRPLTAEQQKAKLDKLKLDFNRPVIIDSSVYVMYPLALERSEESGSGFSSGSYGRPTTYWNILFYNTATGEYHLLNDTLKMAIYSYNPRNADANASSSSFDFDDFLISGYNRVDRLLYFSITTTDFNKDGKLNSDDPNYLFITDKAGRHFKQVSPNNMNVSSWETIKATNKILMMVTRDTNGDNKFDDNDESFPLVYDLTKNTTSSEMFPEDFKMTLKKKLDKQWTKQ
ncbi:MAG: hypothetical protein JST75_08120 [Bacteroidetes bacterium]|nr:hypothetical protein [Bacteroidota bacterium]